MTLKNVSPFLRVSTIAHSIRAKKQLAIRILRLKLSFKVQMMAVGKTTRILSSIMFITYK